MMMLIFLFAISFAKEMLPLTEKVQQYIFERQHPSNCRTKNWVTLEHPSGIGSEIHVSTGALAFALNRDSIFVWANTSWMQGEFCDDHRSSTNVRRRYSFDCVFVPPTNCTLRDLDPDRRLHLSLHVAQSFAYNLLTVVPLVFRNASTSPYPLLYWWRAQGAAYLTHFNERFTRELASFRRQHASNVRIDCGTVCVYVRHGEKYREMQLLPWSRFYAGVQNAVELLALRAAAMTTTTTTTSKNDCDYNDVTTNKVFLMTDDRRVVNNAQHDLGSRLLFVDGSIEKKLPHEVVDAEATAETDTPTLRWHNFMMSMLNLEFCVQCDAFVSQRASNFARLIDELRMTRYGKFGMPFIEAGDYGFRG